jgi:hypothetical protein
MVSRFYFVLTLIVTLKRWKRGTVRNKTSLVKYKNLNVVESFKNILFLKHFITKHKRRFHCFLALAFCYKILPIRLLIKQLIFQSQNG